MVDKLEQELSQHGDGTASAGLRVIPDKLIDSISGAGPSDPPKDTGWIKAYAKWTKSF